MTAEPPPISCRRAYGQLRGRLWCFLNGSQRHMLVRWALWPCRLLVFVPDLFVRWLMRLLDALIADTGYITFGSVAAAYLAVFGLIDAKSTQEETQASVALGSFIALVSSGNVPSFVAALRTFGVVQQMPATEHPPLFEFWKWRRIYHPNEKPLLQWARARLSSCTPRECSLNIEYRIDLKNANLRGAVLSFVDLNGANLDGAQLNRADLTFVNLRKASLRHTFLQQANLDFTDLFEADLRGAILLYANNITGDLRGAIYNQQTIFPPGFNPAAHGMVHDQAPAALPSSGQN